MILCLGGTHTAVITRGGVVLVLVLIVRVFTEVVVIWMLSSEGMILWLSGLLLSRAHLGRKSDLSFVRCIEGSGVCRWVQAKFR